MLRDRIVLVFARLPSDERRAKPFGGGPRVEALHEELLRRTLAVARAAGVKTRLVTTGSLAASGVEVVRQAGDTFAQRLEHAVADAFAEGHSQVVVVGADAPALEAGHIRSAFEQLASPHRSAVLGPALDGGYYLLGLNAFAAEAFRDVPLGTPSAGVATAEALRRAGFSVHSLPPLRDVDREADLLWLGRRGGRLGRAARAARTASARRSSSQSIASSPPLRVIRTRGPPVQSSTIT